MKRWLRLAGGSVLAAALFAGAAGQASAVVIDQWTFELNNAFTEWVPAGGPVPGTPGVDGSRANGVLGGATRIEWPGSFGGDRSALEVEAASFGNVSGTVGTNGPEAAGPNLLHINNPIPLSLQSEFLTQGTLSAQATLTPAGGTDPVGTFTAAFEFLFDETPNIAGTCVAESTSVCDDLFVLNNVVTPVQTFNYLGEEYTLIFDSEDLASFSPATCLLVGIDGPCTGFLTQENATTVFSTFVRVLGPTDQGPISVPEPGILALLGTGLVLLGVIRRRGTAN